MLRLNQLIHFIVSMLVLFTVGCQSAAPVPTMPEITPVPETVTPSATPDELAVVDTPMAFVPTTTPVPTMPEITPSVTPSPTPTITPSFTPTPSSTPLFTPSLTPTPSFTLTPTDTPIPIPEGSPLKRKENSPAGVAAQLGFSAPMSPPCTVNLAPDLSVVAGSIEVLESIVICFSSFDPAQAVALIVPLPDGTTEQHNILLSTPGHERFVWNPLPGLPLGDILLVAQQGQRYAQAQFDLLPSSTRRLVVLTKQGFPGHTFRVALAGFESGEPLYLYYLSEGNECASLPICWLFLTTLTTIQVDSRGEAFYQFVTERDDSTGTYLIATAQVQPSDSFMVVPRQIPLPPIPGPTREGEVAP